VGQPRRPQQLGAGPKGHHSSANGHPQHPFSLALLDREEEAALLALSMQQHQLREKPLPQQRAHKKGAEQQPQRGKAGEGPVGAEVQARLGASPPSACTQASTGALQGTPGARPAPAAPEAVSQDATNPELKVPDSRDPGSSDRGLNSAGSQGGGLCHAPRRGQASPTRAPGVVQAASAALLLWLRALHLGGGGRTTWDGGAGPLGDGGPPGDARRQVGHLPTSPDRGLCLFL